MNNEEANDKDCNKGNKIQLTPPDKASTFSFPAMNADI